jgi:hypothetical protein
MLYVQPMDRSELTNVCRHHGCRQCTGMRGDQQVVRSDRPLGRRQVRPGGTICAARRDIERQRRHLGEACCDPPLEVRRRFPGAPVAQLGGHDDADANLLGNWPKTDTQCDSLRRTRSWIRKQGLGSMRDRALLDHRPNIAGTGEFGRVTGPRGLATSFLQSRFDKGRECTRLGAWHPARRVNREQIDRRQRPVR